MGELCRLKYNLIKNKITFETRNFDFLDFKKFTFKEFRIGSSNWAKKCSNEL